MHILCASRCSLLPTEVALSGRQVSIDFFKPVPWSNLLSDPDTLAKRLIKPGSPFLKRLFKSK